MDDSPDRRVHRRLTEKILDMNEFLNSNEIELNPPSLSELSDDLSEQDEEEAISVADADLLFDNLSQTNE